ncbi:MAG: hypothetical protein JXX29_16645 [Deltaproteobacteria bacterium]|nr:hypothetical protein [Deltaproteobacteria bacterium]MBN2673314.1 hypothetical protein [Deltaproteobacteria bacterium]
MNRMNGLSFFVVSLILALSVSASAQLPGQRINPNVVILLDTGRGMNWTKIVDNSSNPESDERTNMSQTLCEAMNGTALPTSETTAWQMVLESLLGEVPQSFQHCFYEEAVVRPLVDLDTLSGLSVSAATDENGYLDEVSDMTTEYWQFSREPHFRLVNCYDPRDVDGKGRGMWNTTYDQCIGDLPTTAVGEVIEAPNRGKDYWCLADDVYELTNGRKICLDYHPLAMDRETNGLLERYRTLGRFSLMTFDNLPSPTESEADLDGDTFNLTYEHRAGWDYGRDIPWFITAYEQRVPGTAGYSATIPDTSPSRYWNAGVRNTNPSAIGRLVPIADDFESANQDFRAVLNAVEPNHCSFDAAMFDDAGEYLYNNFSTRPMYNGGTDMFFNCRPKLVFFITDGIQTDALEFPQAYCDKAGKDSQPGSPPEPWTALKSNYKYNCPFNSTTTEVSQLHEVVKRLVGSSIDISSVEPMYLVVIGLNMKDKDPETSPDRCDGAPTWVTEFGGGGHCEPPADDCITLKELGQSDCNATAEDSNAYDHQVWVTPRQYLNMLALEGWPEDSSFYPADSSGGKFIQPPWRIEESGTYLWCSDDDNNCGGEFGDPDGTEHGAVFVESREDLAKVMEYALQAISPETVSARTELVTARNPETNATTVTTTDSVAQFIFNSGYRTSADGGPWQGYLYRLGQECTFDDSGAGDTDDTSGGYNDDGYLAYHEELAAQVSTAAGRRVYVLDPAKTFTDFQYTTNVDYQEGLYERLVEFAPANLTDCDLNVTEDGDCLETDYVTEVTRHLIGTNSADDRFETPLGDIYNSTPHVLSPPAERVPIDSYKEFRESQGWTDQVVSLTKDTPAPKYMYDRKPLLFVGSNDGILHSFNVMSEMAGYEDLPVEGWGYVPSPLLTTIGTQFPIQIQRKYSADTSGAEVSYVESYDAVTIEDGGHQHLFGVDAPPLAGDILLYKSNKDGEEKYWRSMVVGALGKGGYGYYALDVTKGPQHEPVFRWELSPGNFGMNAPLEPDANEDLSGLTEGTAEYDEAEALKDSRTAVRAAFSAMGMGLTRPAFSYVYLNGLPPDTSVSSDIPHQVAVAILPGGYKTNESGGMDISTGVYIVRLADGKLIRYLSPGIESDVNDPYGLLDSPLFKGANADAREAKARTAQLVGQPIVPNGIITGKVNDEAYIGDDRGRIWRIDMSSEDPSAWKLEVFFDTLLAEHYPYKDCLSSDSNYIGTTACCDTKIPDVTLECTETWKQGAFASRNNASEFAVDQCFGASCKSPDYPFPRIPMLAPPTIVQDEERNYVLLFGTGQIDGMENLDHHRIFSITVTPTIAVNVDDQGTTGDTSDDVTSSAMTRARPTVNWWLGENRDTRPLTIDGASGLKIIEDAMLSDSTVTEAAKGQSALGGFEFFGLGEKMLGRIHVFRETAYFTTFTPLSSSATKDACSDGGSKIWGVRFNELTDDADVRNYDQMVSSSGTKVAYIAYPGDVLTGLRIVRKPSCGGVEGFALMVQKASDTAMDPPPPSGTPAPPAIITESIDLPVPQGGFTRVGIDSWSIVMGGGTL